MAVLDGKVVLVTGGGRGIGRETALLAAREGAKVVVNDLGGSEAGGDAGDAGPAQAVANEIIQAGGEAVANAGSVTDTAAVKGMFEQAMDTFGGLHAVINPAGNLRDMPFHSMEDADWDALIDVHLRGSYNVCKATINHFREQREGQYVLFSSHSGLIGHPNRAHYAAAKMGIVGLSRVLAVENADHNVHANIIAPVAYTRMIEASIPKDVAPEQLEYIKGRMEGMKQLTPASSAQLAVALAAPNCAATGQIFSVSGDEVSLFSQPRPIQTVINNEGWTPSAILEQAMPAMQDRFQPLDGY